MCASLSKRSVKIDKNPITWDGLIVAVIPDEQLAEFCGFLFATTLLSMVLSLLRQESATDLKCAYLRQVNAPSDSEKLAHTLKRTQSPSS